LPNLSRYKTGSRLPYHLAAQAAQRQDAFEALLVDQQGHVVDGTITSPLLYRDSVLTSLTGGLDGITRYQVIRQAQALGLRVASAALSWPECQGQLLLAGSGVGLVPVGHPVDAAVTELVRLFRPIATG
jgi:branched-subunit amino acid aminotransferase/4-amino-4-deoxychorismate lyase